MHRSRFTTYIIIAVFVALGGYAYFEAGGFLHGPRINLGVESGVLVVNTKLVAIEGSVKNVVELTLNGLPIAIDENGAFTEERLLLEGENDFFFEARDQYNRTTTQTLRVLYQDPLH